MSAPLALVTGVSGYLGAHVVNELLKDGHRVRGTVRPAKLEFVKESFASFPDVEIVGVDDIATGDFSKALESVTAVVHVAAYLPGRVSADEALDSAVQSTLNIARQAEKAGVRKIVAVSSVVAQSSITEAGGRTITADDWNTSQTREDALKPGQDPFLIYAAEKVLSERALWEWADAHPHVEVATVNPAFLLGPFAPGWRATAPNLSSLSTGFILYNLISPRGVLIPGQLITDVRDAAQATVLAFHTPPTAQVGRKRFPVVGFTLDYRAAADYVVSQRPELKKRLSERLEDGRVPPNIRQNFDVSRAKDVLGLQTRQWQETVINSVDNLLSIEREWVAQGWEPAKDLFPPPE